MAGPTLELSLMGTPCLRDARGPVPVSPGPLMLCAYLALADGAGRSRDAAASHLFADSPEPLARRRLSTTLWRLRTEVRAGVGVDLVDSTDHDRVRLSPTVPMSLDTEDFEGMVLAALDVAPDCLTDDLACSLEQAVALRGGALVEPCRDDWVLADRTRIENLYVTALDYLVVHHGRRGDIARVREYGDLALEVEPLREDLHRHLMKAYAAAGRDDLVERQFERCRTVTLAELGVEPMPETVAVRRSLRIPQPRAAADGPSHDLVHVEALVEDLTRARRDVERIASLLDSTLAHLRQLRC